MEVADIHDSHTQHNRSNDKKLNDKTENELQ